MNSLNYRLTKNLIQMELARYNKLSMPLAMLYLTLNKGNWLYLGNLKIIATAPSGNNTLDLQMKIIDIETSEDVGSRLASISHYIKSNTKRQTSRFYNNFSKNNKKSRTLDIDINTYFYFKPNSTNNSAIIYNRNERLRCLVKELVNHFKDSDCKIPPTLIYPYLYLHKNDYLRSEAGSLDTTSWNSTKFISFCKSNNSLKVRNEPDFKSFVIKPIHLNILWGEPASPSTPAATIHLLNEILDSKYYPTNNF